MSWATIRTGMETRLETIDGLVVHPRMQKTLPDKDVAVVLPGEPLIVSDGHGSLFSVIVRVVVICKRADANDAQLALDAFVWPTGASSVIAAVDGDTTLGGTVAGTRFLRVASYGINENEPGAYQADVLFEARA